jgi:hypothetical protein
MTPAAPLLLAASRDGVTGAGAESEPRTTPGGAYGLRVGGVDVPPGQLVDAPADWPSVELRVRVTAATTPAFEYVNERAARLNVRSGGAVLMDRAAATATFTLPAAPSGSALLHPHLAAVGAVWAHWLGREAFHSGAFVAGGGVWGLLGEKGDGKSSTLAALARAEVPIVCDDVLVLDDGHALAGPRSIDLRADASRRLGIGERLGIVGDRERWRVPLEPIEPALPFRGWVALRWSEQPSVKSLEGAERLRALLQHRALRVPPSAPTTLLNLAGLPFLELSRPRRWTEIEGAVELLLDALSA